jgi:superfamily II DNA or RNA helicase
LRQASNKLSAIGVNHGIIAPSHSMTGDLVQVASIQTTVRRLDRINEPSLIIIDEAHHSVAGNYRKLVDRFPRARLLGVTATPCRLDGHGLGKQAGGYFDCMVQGPAISDLIAAGYLSKPVIYAPPTDFSTEGIHIRCGDFAQDEVADRIDKPKITGSAIEHYLRLCPGLPAITFCVSIRHAEHVAQEFNAAGIRTMCIHGQLADRQRDAAIRGLADGTWQNLTSCELISEGTDIPVVAAGIGLRPTASLGMYMQQVGRILRIYPGKTSAIWLDHVGNCRRHGLPTDLREWSLDGLKKRKRAEQESSLSVKQCVKCFAMFPASTKVCPQCGEPVVAAAGREIKQVDGELKKIEPMSEQEFREHIARMDRRREEGRANTLEDLIRIADERGYNRQWAYIRWNLKKNRTAVKQSPQMEMEFA